MCLAPGCVPSAVCMEQLIPGAVLALLYSDQDSFMCASHCWAWHTLVSRRGLLVSLHMTSFAPAGWGMCLGKRNLKYKICGNSQEEQGWDVFPSVMHLCLGPSITWRLLTPIFYSFMIWLIPYPLLKVSIFYILDFYWTVSFVFSLWQWDPGWHIWKLFLLSLNYTFQAFYKFSNSVCPKWPG